MAEERLKRDCELGRLHTSPSQGLCCGSGMPTSGLSACTTSPAWPHSRTPPGRHRVCVLCSVVSHRDNNKRHWDFFPSKNFSGKKEIFFKEKWLRDGSEMERLNHFQFWLFCSFFFLFRFIYKNHHLLSNWTRRTFRLRALQKTQASEWERGGDSLFVPSFKWDLFCCLASSPSSSIFSQFFFKKKDSRISLSMCWFAAQLGSFARREWQTMFSLGLPIIIAFHMPS